MNHTKFSDDVRPVTELKTRASRLLDQAHRTRRPVLLTRRGRGVAVLLDLGVYENLVERAEFIEAVEDGVRAARAGDVHSNEEAERILDSFGRADV